VPYGRLTLIWNKIPRQISSKPNPKANYNNTFKPRRNDSAHHVGNQV